MSKNGRSNMRAWSWVRVDGRNVVAVPTQQQIHLYDSDDFILLSTIARSGHASAIAKVRWSAFHAKLASLSATQLIVHAPQLVADDALDDHLDADVAVHRHTNSNNSKKKSLKKVQFAPMWQLPLHGTNAIYSFSFSRCAERLLFSDSNGISILDIRNYEASAESPVSGATADAIPHAQVLWRSGSDQFEATDNEIVKFSPSEYVFASLKAGQSRLKVWRMADDTVQQDGDTHEQATTTARFSKKKVVRVDELAHPDPIVYYSWKPANTQLHATRTLDGSHKAQWFEPSRVLLTCSVSRVIRIWTEHDYDSSSDLPVQATAPSPVFIAVLVYQPHEPIDNFRWVLSKNRNISEEKFGSTHEQSQSQIDWVSGVDRRGILHLWRLIGVPTSTPRIEETGVCIQVNGEESEQHKHSNPASAPMNLPPEDATEPLSEICIMAYFSQDYFEIPSTLDIVLQRADNIILSYNVAVARVSRRPHVKRKSWYRSHSGSISALAAHPSLPLIASVGAEPSATTEGTANGHQTRRYEILIFWISFSAFSAESRLIPSGVLTCAPDCGEVLCVQWVPTLHFDATPLLLVAFASGTIEVYGRAANAAGVVSSPKRARERSPHSRHEFGRSPSVSPWTFFDYNTGESRAEYEVVFHKHEQLGVGFSLESKGGKLVVSELANSSKRGAVDQVSLGDEIVGLSNTNLTGKSPAEVQKLLDAIPIDEVFVVRFRAKSAATRAPILATVDIPNSRFGNTVLKSSDSDFMPPHSPATAASTDDDESDARSVEVHSQKLRNSFLSSAMENLEHLHVVHAGNVSMYGGWCQLLRVKAASSLALLCVCPVYADDGEYAPNTVLLFGLTSLPGKLSAWKGVRSSSSKSYELSSLTIENHMILRKHDISSIAGERDYRQRAFSDKKQGENHSGLNSLLFMGDASGSIQHWRCRLSSEKLTFTLMSTACTTTTATGDLQKSIVPQDYAPTANGGASFDKFFRRGYVDPSDGNASSAASHPVPDCGGVHHIEVDDPNRIAVLDIAKPDTLHIYEAESGLGILRLEESIASAGRGNILGFCWCNAHVEFNVDVLAVHYSSGIVLYQYDMNVHRWVQIGDDIVTPHSIFDCTRDSSALLIGGGFLKHNSSSASNNQVLGSNEYDENAPVSNEMPDVLGKWDEPGTLLQYSMDWKAAESPQKLPIWHPYVIITTLFGMHARVGVKDTQLADDKPAYEFSKAFKDAVQMLKLLAKVIEDRVSAQVSARSGVLSYSATRAGMGSLGRRDSVGRYSTAVHTKEMSKAEHLFGESLAESDDIFLYQSTPKSDGRNIERLGKSEVSVISEAIDALLLHTDTEYKENGALLFASFDEEHFLEMKAILHYIDAVQSLGFEMDASAADLGAKRYLSSHIFAKSLKNVLSDPKFTPNVSSSSYNHNGGDREEPEKECNGDRGFKDHQSFHSSGLEESPSSGILWALHSDSQQFLLDNCVHPQASWDDLRPMWLGLWVKNTKDLRTIVERLAKSTFARTKDAIDVCLFYIALGKKNVLGALAKISKAEQNKKLALFLDHDFSQERWCNAAVKNAYSLLSKKQYETAAAFFLICEPPRLQEALRVLAVRMSDLSLALIVSRLVEYRTSDKFQQDFISSASQHDVTGAEEVTRSLLEQDIVPHFRKKKDRWMESCALWWLEDFEQASTVLLPLSQAVDAADAAAAYPKHTQSDVLIRCKAAVHFYVNLTSIPIYFQYLHSSVNSALISWAMKKQKRALALGDASETMVSATTTRRKLASTADIEHAFSFSAYACKRNGLSDTALIEMLQARHLVNVHARFEIAAAESGDPSGTGGGSQAAHARDDIVSPRVRSSMRNLNKLDLRVKPPHSTYEPRSPWSSSPRRMSDMHQLDLSSSSSSNGIDDPNDKRHLFLRSNTTSLSRLLLQPGEKQIPNAPWLKAQIADIECRRWSSSAFVGKMIGIRVAREMISHFRAELDLCFRHYDPAAKHFRAEPHKEFLEELCAPLCQQFQVDRNYVVEAALGVMQPHAYLHIVEVCFLLSELGRSATLCKWIQYVSLSMLHSCSTFASCKITDDIYRDWEGLTIQLCYILNLDAQGQLQLPNSVVAQVAVAVRTGCIFLSWSRHQSNIIHEAILAPFFVNVKERSGVSDEDYFAELSMFSFEQNLSMIRKLQQQETTNSTDSKTWNFAGTFGYTFLETVALYLQGKHGKEGGGGNGEQAMVAVAPPTTREKIAAHWRKLRKMYTLILMVSILRTHYARSQVFLSEFTGANEVRKDLEELDISSSLFTPRKMWKFLEEGPLDGIKRWYSLMESHLRCEFDYSVKEVACLCGLYGLDGSALKLVKQVADHSDNDKTREQLHPHHHHLPHFHLHHLSTQVHHNTDEQQCDPLQSFLHKIGISEAIHAELVKKSDDYILLLMQHPRLGVAVCLRRFRVDPRVHVTCFLVQDAFDWFSRSKIYSTADDCHQFLKRCCKARKLRLLVQQLGQEHHHFFFGSHGDKHRGSHHHEGDNPPGTEDSDDDDDTEKSMTLCQALEPTNGVSEKLLNEAIMFVNPWEVEAVESVLRYMHKMHAPRHVELGWDRLSPICAETCDNIIASVFGDNELVEMWKSTCGEGWLVTSITQYQLDGGYSPRTTASTDRNGSEQKQQHCTAAEENQKVPFLVEIHARSQRNAMFREVGLPHRFIGVLSSDPYVFLALAYDSKHCATADSWSIQTHRSRVGIGGVNPRWGEKEDQFSFRFAIPTHHVHLRSSSSDYSSAEKSSAQLRGSSGSIENAWSSSVTEESKSAARGLESLFQAMYTGPPILLNCSVFHKNKLMPHHFMGKGKVALNQLTSGNPIDCWLPLDEVPSGALRVKVSLSFRLMCSSVAGAQEIDDILDN